MDISVTIQDGVACIALSGRFDFKECRVLLDACTPLLDNPDVSEIEIEIDNLDFMDSSALGILLMLDERAKACHKSISLIKSSSPISMLLSASNFSEVLRIKDRT
jgi:anti-anti-sigma factor